jgi:hypothetical protein
MMTDQAKTYEQVEDQQRRLCKELNHPYLAAHPDSKVGFALETRGHLPINGLRHPPQGNTTGWYLWCGEEFPSDDHSFSPVHTRHLLQLQPEVLKFLGLPPGYRFLTAGDYVDVWYDATLLNV